MASFWRLSSEYPGTPGATGYAPYNYQVNRLRIGRIRHSLSSTYTPPTPSGGRSRRFESSRPGQISGSNRPIYFGTLISCTPSSLLQDPYLQLGAIMLPVPPSRPRSSRPNPTSDLATQRAQIAKTTPGLPLGQGQLRSLSPLREQRLRGA